MINNKNTNITSIRDLDTEFSKSKEYVKAKRIADTFMKISLNIIKIRHMLGVSQKELAKRASTFQSRISKIETGDHDLRLSTLLELADALDQRVVIEFIPKLEYSVLIDSQSISGNKDQYENDQSISYMFDSAKYERVA